MKEFVLAGTAIKLIKIFSAPIKSELTLLILKTILK